MRKKITQFIITTSVKPKSLITLTSLESRYYLIKVFNAKKAK